MTSTLISIGSIAGIVLVALVLLVFLVKSCYKIAGTNEVLVVTGLGKAKTVSGKGVFVIPLVQKIKYMTLENIQVDFTSRDEIPTKDAINILVDAVANMSVSMDPEIQKVAASKFVGYSLEDIQRTVTPVLEGNIREIISQTTLKELIQGDKKEFAERVVENVTPNLRDMGLNLTTFNIQNFKDKNGIIENLGIENTVQISKDAAKAKAAAQSEIAIAQAEADKLANDAKVKAATEIAEKNNEFAIKQANLKKMADIEQAKADAAKGIQAEEQRKTQEIATAEANLARQEKEIQLKEREVQIKEQTLEAEVKKTAEAEKYAEQQRADAKLYTTQKSADAQLFERQKKAEAEKFEAQQKAEANKALAQAEAEAKKALAEALKAQGVAEAEATKAKGEAEAAAIQAKAEAEAEGLMKKAEAMKQYGEAAQMDMQMQALKLYFEQLPAIAKAVGDGYQNVDKIVMLGGESSKLSGDILNNVTQISEGLSQSLGIDLKTLLAGFMGGKIAAADKE